MTSKRLGPDQLGIALAMLEDRSPTLAEDVCQHLETLEAELAQARKERDEAVADNSALLEEHRKALVTARDEGRTQGIREAMTVCKEEGHAELMPCIADLLEGPEE